MVDEKQTPDFDALNDRLIAEQPKGPTFGIKTNLDPKTPFEENPYAENVKSKKGQQQLEDFFE
ncbi:hypothetical protein [Scopulibacillus cellulosilyticus]|uniref:Uncharacterized protein n=1 Tax=Scopulibacillus cellulosilyticus TaxID=2665665 RepID=A0ABW2PXS5_9BACL